jgi:membrane protein DedA with SNARE-associated domain/rhodanese-related sulfurtransferase
VLAAAVFASLVADVLWYVVGRALGYRVLAGLCYLSINPASCVSQTETRFARWGLPSLVMAKFIPGFSAAAPPIAGAMRMALSGFLLASAIGAVLWAGLAVGAGWLLRESVIDAMALLDRHAGVALLVVVLSIVVWLAWKSWKKVRFQRLAALPHITPAELLPALEADDPMLLLDLRASRLIAEAGSIPGAVTAELDRLDHAVHDWPKAQPIVTLCACPQDASAVQAARHLLAQGFASVRPLKGGYDSWLKETQRGGRVKSVMNIPLLTRTQQP